MLAGDHGAHVRLSFAVGGTDFEAAGGFDEGGEHGFFRRADDDGGGPGHATFTGAAEGGFDEAARGILHIRIGHEDDVIFGAAIGLHAFAVLGAGLVNVPGDGRGADEGDGFHLGMREEGIHHFPSAVHDVQHAFGQAGLFEQARDFQGGERNFFTRLEHEGVAAGDGNGIHPQRHHGGKVERRDADAHAQGLADGFAINAARHVLENFAHEHGRRAAGEFDDLHAALHIAARLDEGLAVFAGVAADDVLKIFLEEHFEFEQHAGAFHGRCFHPRGEGGGGGLDGGVYFSDRAGGALGDDFAGGRVEYRGAGGGGQQPFAANVGGAGGEGFGHVKKAPSTNIQAPEKLQTSKLKSVLGGFDGRFGY